MILLQQILSIQSSNMHLAYTFQSLRQQHTLRGQPARSKHKCAGTEGSKPKGKKGTGFKAKMPGEGKS